MRIKKAYTYRLRRAPDEVVGHFGPVRLVKKSNGLHRLSGGDNTQQKAVRKWCKRFAPDIVRFDVTVSIDPEIFSN